MWRVGGFLYISELFEKRERSIYQLFLLLRIHDGIVSIKEACHVLDISKSTLLRYIETFCEEASSDKIGLQIRLHNEELHLQRDANLSRQELLYYLCQSSLKFQILLYLFEKNEFSIPSLSQELLISEATLNRQLSSLNKLLKGFEISIRSGKWKGSELQIRYFYFQLFWLTFPVASLEQDRVFKEQLRYLPIFERFYHSKLNPRQSHQMALWLMIVYKRMRLKDLDFQACYRLIAPYKDHKFYRNLRNLFLTLSQQFSASFQEGDTMSVFAFLFSQGILEAHQLEQLLGFGGPIMEATTWGFKQLKLSLKTELPVEESELYHLNQVFSHLYFFTCSLESELGDIDVYDKRLQLAARNIVETVYRDIYGRKNAICLDSHCLSLLELFSYLMQVEPTIVQVGLASSYPAIVTYPILHMLQQELESNRSIVIEPLQENKVYDFIICHDYLLEGETVYQLYGRPSSHDLQQLKQIISHLRKEKIEQAKRLVERSYFLIERR